MGAENSYEWMLYQQLASSFRNDSRVRFIAPKSQLVYVPVYDFNLRFTHGDTVKSGGGVGGITIPIFKKLSNWDAGCKADVTIMGHFHQYMSLPHLVVNGSLCGYGPYAVSIGAKFERPQQAFFLMDSQKGKTASYPVWLD